MRCCFVGRPVGCSCHHTDVVCDSRMFLSLLGIYWMRDHHALRPTLLWTYYQAQLLEYRIFVLHVARVHECRQVCVCGFVCVVPFMRLCDFGWTAWIVQNYYLFMHRYLHCNVCEAFVELRNSHRSIDLWNSEVFTRHCNGNNMICIPAYRPILRFWDIVT